MLKELRIVYEDGTKYTKIVHSNNARIYPRRDKIRHCECGPFKYRVEKHAYLCVSIVKFGNKYMIMPAGVPCIPETTLEDIETQYTLEQSTIIKYTALLAQIKKEQYYTYPINSSVNTTIP